MEKRKRSRSREYKRRKDHKKRHSSDAKRASSSKIDSKQEELEKRKQRLKKWQMNRDKVSASIKPAEIKKTVITAKLWKQEDDNSVTLNNNIPAKELVPDGRESADALDEYMQGLTGIANQESVDRKQNTSITLDEITSFLPSRKHLSTTYEDDAFSTAGSEINENAFEYGGTTPGRVVGETEEEKNERERKEHEEFMKAIKLRNSRTMVTSKLMEEEAPEVIKEELGRIYQGHDEDIIGEVHPVADQRTALEILQEAQKKKEVRVVDHDKMEYPSFRKKFYIAPKEINDMTEANIEIQRMGGEMKVRGKNCPRPISRWNQCGFSERMLKLIRKGGYEVPFAIQQQAIPAILSGRDVIGIAKTGSGKTLAFLLPLFRHILDQPQLADGDGPIGLILAPARELALQIHSEARKFCKHLGMRATAVYGGSSVSEQIANLKRGSDIVICTPGRMIDIMCMNAGRLLSLSRVTYVILDEADRMFDMGFEPQIAKILGNVRPDRQTLLFSATFPRSVEALARKTLKRPVEITVGARSTASGDITQYVEVRDEDDKFMRLLQLLGVWYEKGNVLVFVNTQQACDNIFQSLMKAGYPALSLHGGKDQMDRDYTIDDFKRKVRSLMVATSVAGRGLDVKDLVLVINYHCPNHLEDYVHRVGRTGRAGRKGTAYTFISPDEEQYAPDLVKALENAKQNVPPELVTLNDGFKEKVKRGEARYHGSGFKGKGFTFDENEKTDAQKLADLQRHQYDIEQGIVEDDAQEIREQDAPQDAAQAAQMAADAISSGKSKPGHIMSAVKKAQQIAMMLGKGSSRKSNFVEKNSDGHYEIELEINDYPQQARWKVCTSFLLMSCI